MGIFRHGAQACSSIFGHFGHMSHAFSCGKTPHGQAYSLHAPILLIKTIKGTQSESRMRAIKQDEGYLEFYQAVVGIVSAGYQERE